MVCFKVCTFGGHNFGFSDQISQQARTVRFVKLQVLEFYGLGGGLRHLSFTGPVIQGGTINIKTTSTSLNENNTVPGVPKKMIHKI